jgi:glucan endo-1,3-beta-D-glucosidase
MLTAKQQGGTANDPISAIPAAIAADTTLLLGIWASAGQEGINNEIAALKRAIEQYGSDFTSRVTGLSVGSEDLYRLSPTGIAAKSGYGAEPADLVSYIGQVRQAIAGTALSGTPIGHVDTWNDWVNGSNSAVIQAVDWLGVDAYPYFQTSMANGIDNGPQLFFDAYDATVGAAGGKDVWITETGWPVSGPVSGQAEASLANAKFFWDKVACPSLGKINTYWYTLQDSYPNTPSPSFGVVGTTLNTTPLFDLSCPSADTTTTTTPATSAKDVASSSSSSTEAAPSSILASGVAAGSGSANASSTLIAVPSSAAGNASTAVGGGAGSAAPTGAAGTGSGSGAGSASPSGGSVVGGGSSSGSGSGTTGNGTVVSPAPTAGSTTGAATGAAPTAGAGAGLAFGAAIMAVVAAF